jgi:predicted nicotinamide N-methyase
MQRSDAVLERRGAARHAGSVTLATRTDAGDRAFVRAHTTLRRPPLLPEVALWLAGEVVPLWEATERRLGVTGTDPPFWGYAWAGGQAVARYVLDHPAEVAGRTVLDLAAGGGVCAVAAALSGATRVEAADIGPFAGAATALNADANGVRVMVTATDLLGQPPPDVDVVLAGDVCYERRMAARMLGWLATAHRRGSRVLLGDPGRAYLPGTGFTRVAGYDVPTLTELEGDPVRRTAVFSFSPRPPGNGDTPS